MHKIKLDSILLFALLIPFIMTYRISPGDTPYWLFGLILMGLFLYLVSDINLLNWSDFLTNKVKNFSLWTLIVLSIGAGYYSAIIVRHQTSPEYNVHDIILQQESAIRFFLHGKNPYALTYFGTPMEKWHYSDTEVNPALYHFVMEPFYMLFAIPFYLIMSHTVGFFDARIPLVFLFIVLLIFAWKLVNEADKKKQFVILLAFNPATLGYFLEGRDDIFMFSFLFAALYFLHQKKWLFSSILMALAFVVKQSVWPIFPFYFAFLLFQTKDIKKIILNLLPFTATFLVIVLPFFLWNPKAFLDSTIFYLSGNVAHSYPIAGYGWGVLLNEFGFIKNVHMYYPFWIWQVIFCLPLLAFLIKWQSKENSVQRLVIAYGLFLFVFWYFSRYFHNSHLGYISMIFITAYFWPDTQTDKNKIKKTN